jgi:hypothetical protein
MAGALAFGREVDTTAHEQGNGLILDLRWVLSGLLPIDSKDELLFFHVNTSSGCFTGSITVQSTRDDSFYDRESEIEELQRIQKLAFTDYSKMTVATGRRRIGKTNLITEALARSAYAKSEIPTLYLLVSRKNEGALCRHFAEGASKSLEENQALVAEVKRKQESFGMSKLKEKVKHQKEKAMPKYDFEPKCLSR